MVRQQCGSQLTLLNAYEMKPCIGEIYQKTIQGQLCTCLDGNCSSHARKASDDIIAAARQSSGMTRTVFPFEFKL